MVYLRFLAVVLLVVAVFAVTADVTRSIGTHSLVLTPSLTHWERLSPTSLKNFESLITRTGGTAVWTMGVRRVLNIPAALMFLTLGLVAGYFGRRRRRINIYSN